MAYGFHGNGLGVVKEGKFALLVVGVSEFKNFKQSDWLKGPVEDAKAIFEVLTENYIFDYAPKLLLNSQGTKDAIEDHLISFAEGEQKLSEDDTLVIYMAMHGEENGENSYWQCYDAQASKLGSWFNHSDFRSYLNKIKARHILVIVDSCFGGGVTGKRFTQQDPVPIDLQAARNWYKAKSHNALVSGGMVKVDDTVNDGKHRSAFSLALEQVLRDEHRQYFCVINNYAFIKAYNSAFTCDKQEVEYTTFKLGDSDYNGEALLFRRNYDPKINPPFGFEEIEKGYETGIASYLISQSYYSWEAHKKLEPLPEGKDYEVFYNFDEKELSNRVLCNTKPIILVGNGGVGKTRLALQIGRAAEKKKWLVWKITSDAKIEDFQKIAPLLRQYDRKLLLILDHAEKILNYGLDNLISELSRLQAISTIRLLLTCREPYWRNFNGDRPEIFANEKCEALMLSEAKDRTAKTWLHSWQRGIYASISGKNYDDLDITNNYTAFYAILEKHIGAAIDIVDRQALSSRVIERLRDTIKHAGKSHLLPVNFPTEITNFLMLFPWTTEKPEGLSDFHQTILDALVADGFASRSNGKLELGHDLLCDLCFEHLIYENYDNKPLLIANLGEFAQFHNNIRSLSQSLYRNLPYLSFYAEQQFDDEEIGQEKKRVISELASIILQINSNNPKKDVIENILSQKNADEKWEFFLSLPLLIRLPELTHVSMLLTSEEKDRVFSSFTRLSNSNFYELVSIFDEESERLSELASYYPTYVFGENFFLSRLSGDLDTTLKLYEKISVLPVAIACLNFLKNRPYTMPKGNPENQTTQIGIFEICKQYKPRNADTIGNYAIYMTDIAGDQKRAGELFKEAYDTGQASAAMIGNYANYMKNIAGDQKRAGELYKEAYDTGQASADMIGNYAIYMTDIAGDQKRAGELFKEAYDTGQASADMIGNYANYMTDIAGDQKRAGELYKEAYDTGQASAAMIGNYAKFLLVYGTTKKALSMLAKAERCPDTDKQPDELKLGLAFYRYCHVRPFPLVPIKALVEKGVRCIGWPLEKNHEKGIEDGHPNPELLTAIVRVISEGEDLDILSSFPEWQDS